MSANLEEVMEVVTEVAMEVATEVDMVEATEVIAVFVSEEKVPQVSELAADTWVQEAAVKPLVIMLITVEPAKALEVDTMEVLETQELL